MRALYDNVPVPSRVFPRGIVDSLVPTPGERSLERELGYLYLERTPKVRATTYPGKTLLAEACSRAGCLRLRWFPAVACSCTGNRAGCLQLRWLHAVALVACCHTGCLQLHWLPAVALVACSCTGFLQSRWLPAVALIACSCSGCMQLHWLLPVALVALVACSCCTGCLHGVAWVACSCTGCVQLHLFPAIALHLHAVEVVVCT